jgi:two-component system, NarL family, sensor histidine kinase UhpB
MPVVEARTSSLPLEGGPTASTDAATLQSPLELPRLLMRRTVPVALGFLVLALLVAALAAQRDTAEEVDGALATARLSRYLSNLPQLSDEQALAVLRQSSELRHLALRVTDGEGRTRLGEPPPASATENAVSWTVTRPSGLPWTVSLAASARSELAEAAQGVLEMLLIFGLCCFATLAVMRWNLMRALAPLRLLTAAAGAGQRHELHRLPTLPVGELEQIATGMRRLSTALHQAEQARRALGAQVQTVQEDERRRLARDLHDEFGQRLTSLRVDVTWLRRRLQDDERMEPVLGGMLAQVSHIQQGLRGLLARLNPLSLEDAGAEVLDPPERLHDLLLQMTEDWSGADGGGVHCSLDFDSHLSPLPRPLLLAVYRMSQEALTNATRHAGAGRVQVRVHLDRSGAHDNHLEWSVEDDGVGITDLDAARRRGSGLAGLQERARAFGGELQIGTGPGGRGLRLSTRLPLDLG